jgi:PadR family transcriptional regulator PadR
VREHEAEGNQAGHGERERTAGARAAADCDERGHRAADAEDRLRADQDLSEVRGGVAAQLVEQMEELEPGQGCQRECDAVSCGLHARVTILIIGIPVVDMLGPAMAEAPPLREPTFFVLTALLAGPRHGYGIIKAVEEMSDGRVRLRAGTLYAALERLESAGYVELDREESEGGPPRRYYRLTPAGVALIEAEGHRLAQNARLVREGLRRAAPGTA